MAKTKQKRSTTKLRQWHSTAAWRLVRCQRPLHRKVLLHPIMLFALLCVGVALADTTWHSVAASINVHAKVSAPLLTEPAVITSPGDGATFSAIPITVSGTCPADSYVKLTRNDLFSGVDICASGFFHITTDLFAGANQLVAQDYNITDDAGPTSPATTVTYTAPAPPPSGPSSNPTGGTESSVPASPLLLTAAFRYQVFQTGQTFQWNVGISGGTPPYVVKKVWGDGTTADSPIGSAPEFTISHAYTAAGRYVVLLEATDARGATAVLQLMAIITAGLPPGATAGSSAGSSSGPSPSLWLWVAVPAYTTVLLMAVSFLLGERQELLQLRRRRRRHAT